MRYKISGKQINIGESLQTHVEMEVSDILENMPKGPLTHLLHFQKNLMNLFVRQPYTFQLE